MNISVIIPTFNEQGNIVKLVTDIRETVTKINIQFEIVIVDDDSTDGTSDFCKEIVWKSREGAKIIEMISN